MSKRDRESGATPDEDASMALTVRGSTSVIEPIVVPNTLWRSTDPTAYQGGLDSDITHLERLELDPEMRRDNARWTGPLEVIPTKAD
jgi:hypothetical protein